MMRSKQMLSLTLLAALVAGCNLRVSESNNGEKNKNVAITSALGNLKVRTGDVEAKDTGLSVYPGSRVKEKSKNNENQANVNIDTRWGGLKVVAITYETDDPMEKIWDYYKKEISRYGKPLECRPGSPDLQIHKHDDDDLTCDDHDSKNPTSDTELKVGTEKRQRIVAVKPSGKGTEYSLVYVVIGGKDSI